MCHMCRIVPVLAAIVLMAGCANSQPGSSLSLAGPSAVGSANSSAGSQLTVEPTTLFVDSCILPNSGTVTVSTNFGGKITATVDNPSACTVSPGSQQAVGTPGGGGMKATTFQVTILTGAMCNVTLAANKNNTATVMVRPQLSGSCIV